MTLNKLMIVTAAVLLTLAASCATMNVFSFFENTATNPSDTNVADVPYLILTGDSYLNRNDFTNAFSYYSNAHVLSNTEPRAIEGMCTCYLFIKIPISNLYYAIINTNFSSISLTLLYDVSRFITTNLLPLTYKPGDLNGIPSSNVNMNMNFSLFNAFNTLFWFIDTDDNGDVNNDTNDVITVISLMPPMYTNYLSGYTNDFGKMMVMMNKLSARMSVFTNTTNGINRSLIILSNVALTLKSQSAKDMLNNFVMTNILKINDTIADALHKVGFTGTGGIISFTNLMSMLGTNITNMSDAINVLTNMMGGSGVTNYSNFISNLNSQGITNGDITDLLTNMFPDLSGVSNLNGILTNILQ